jgi:hypothetical protein
MSKMASWQRRGNTAQIASAIAAIVVPIFVALSAYIGVTNQIKSGQENSRESLAKNIFRSYLQLAFEHPDFAGTNYAHLKESDKAKTQYRFFVTNLLYSCEEILTVFVGDEEWRHACRTHVEPHARYLCDVYDEDRLQSYAEVMQKFIEDVMKDEAHSYVECAGWWLGP